MVMFVGLCRTIIESGFYGVRMSRQVRNAMDSSTRELQDANCVERVESNQRLNQLNDLFTELMLSNLCIVFRQDTRLDFAHGCHLDGQ